MKKIITLLLCLPLLGLSQNITDSLLLYYPMDGNTDDYSGNNFHGIPNGVTDTANRFGNPNSAYYFDGIDDFIDLPLTNTLKPQFPITFAFWAKVTVLGSQENKFFSTDFVQDNYHGIWMAVNYLGELNIHFGGGNGACNTTNRRGLNTIEHYIQPGLDNGIILQELLEMLTTWSCTLIVAMLVGTILGQETIMWAILQLLMEQ